MRPEALNKEGENIFAKLKNFPEFYLAGGTALALQIGHRISVDFDLFSSEEISKGLLSEIKRVFSSQKLALSISNPDELTVFVNGIKISFIKYPFPIISDFAEYEKVKLAGIKEIAAMKAYVIGRRGSYKDYIDLYFIIYKGFVSLEEIINLSEKKYGSEFNSRLFLEQLVYLDDIEDMDILFLENRVGKAELKTFFEEKIKKLKL